MKRLTILLLVGAMLLVGGGSLYASDSTGLISADLPWWGWALLLFGITVCLGIVAVIGGVGGGVLFVPIVSALFPFHFDYVRGAGLMVVLCGALSAGPRLLKRGLASVRLGLPLALVGSIGSIIGATIGLALPTSIVQGLLGTAIIGIVVLMLVSKRSEFPEIGPSDPLSRTLGIQGSFYDPSIDRTATWHVHRMPIALVTFAFIGMLSGMFGMGAGWANVPALNLLLGAPMKVAVGTSGFILSMNATAAWVYLHGGAVLPLIAVPSVAGMMLGARIGARLLPHAKVKAIRWVVISLLVVSGVRSLITGLQGVWQ